VDACPFRDVRLCSTLLSHYQVNSLRPLILGNGAGFGFLLLMVGCCRMYGMPDFAALDGKLATGSWFTPIIWAVCSIMLSAPGRRSV
jgi:hypothetical protein